MANPEHLEEQREETRLIIEELLEDGSDPDALYTIEHHLLQMISKRWKKWPSKPSSWVTK
jgi:regulator of RNase E activity RraB